MNKLTKNKIWFNLEKIISIITASAIVITTVVMMSSCSTQKTMVGNYYNKSAVCPAYH
jgi:hypothetical protein|tara:strand:+ start:372 stop:545 length:174 start_codon:yes stop_codon:yes gene_type:complete